MRKPSCLTCEGSLPAEEFSRLPSRDELTSSCKRLVEPFKEISEKLARVKVVSGSRDRKNRAYFLLFKAGKICR